MTKKSQTAISIRGVSKHFRLPHERYAGLKQAIIHFRPGKRYEEQHVLENISFDIEKGEFFGIVGRNGSGKSTLLKLIAQIYTPNRGEILVEGSLTPFIELGVGFNPELTGRENVFLNGALLGFDRKQMGAMYDGIVEFAELEEFMDVKLKNYSSGMQVRLAFSVAIRVQSDILVLDEVLAVGDAAFQRKCYDYFMELKKKHATVVLVTHDMNAIRQYCDRAVLIEGGHILKEGSPEMIAQDYQRLFIEDAREDDNTDTGPVDRWGNGNAVALMPHITVTEELVSITTTFDIKKRVDTFVAGFTVHSPNGLNLLEDNTLRHKVRATGFVAGEEVSFTWEVPNIFATGKYSISVACCDQSTTTFYDWLNNAASFDVTKEMMTSGAVNPTIKLLHNDLLMEK